jgi:hypothetical protein
MGLGAIPEGGLCLTVLMLSAGGGSNLAFCALEGGEPVKLSPLNWPIRQRVYVQVIVLALDKSIVSSSSNHGGIVRA